jgi:hypothetical protein
MNIIRAFHDRNLLGYGVHDFSSFKNWEVCQRAIYGLALISDERARYTRDTRIEPMNRKPVRKLSL